MDIGGLSEKELQKITDLLESENIKYEVGTDQNMIDKNNHSIRYNLRHLNSPSISTHILSLSIDDKEFELLSNETREKLLELGITNEVPSEFESLDKVADQKQIHEKLQEGNRRLIGTNYLLELILAGIAGFVWYLTTR